MAAGFARGAREPVWRVEVEMVGEGLSGGRVWVSGMFRSCFVDVVRVGWSVGGVFLVKWTGSSG